MSAWFLFNDPEIDVPSITTYQTKPGEIEEYQLEDGSLLILGPLSELKISLASDVRHAELASGEAFFDVVSVPSRPFQVSMDSMLVQVTGTRFDVQSKGALAQVSVQEGSVLVTRPVTLLADLQMNSTVALEAGQKVVSSETKGFGEIAQIDPAKVAAWRRGQLDYEDVPLSTIVHDLNRYQNKVINIRDAKAADLLLSASFDSQDVDKVLQSLTEVLPLGIDQTDNGSVVLYSTQ
ncbi:MAG: FecR domain-containing protein [Pseudomonadota bacterium]